MKKAILLLLLTTAVGCTVIPDADSSSTSEIFESSSSEILVPSTSEIVFEVAENNFVKYLSPGKDLDVDNPFWGELLVNPSSSYILNLDRAQTKYICNSLRVAELVLCEDGDICANYYNEFLTSMDFSFCYPFSDYSSYISGRLLISKTGTIYLSNMLGQRYESAVGAVDYQFYMDYYNDNKETFTW